MKILITGGGGFIGTNLTLRANEQGYSVVIVDNLEKNGSSANLELLRSLPNVEVVEQDITAVNELKESKELNCIVHLAANVDAEKAFRMPTLDLMVNGVGTLNVLEYARNNGQIPIIYASTCKIYSTKINELPLKELDRRYEFQTITGIDEGFDVNPHGPYAHGPYGCSKYVGELYAREFHALYGLPVLVNRISTVYGPHQHGVRGYGWVGWFAKAVKQELPLTIHGNGKQVRDVLHVDDLSRLLLKQIEGIEKHSGSIYNVGGGPECTLSVLELLDLLAKLKGKPSKQKITFDSPRLGDFKVYVSNIAKVTEDWDWKPEVFQKEGIERLWIES